MIITVPRLSRPYRIRLIAIDKRGAFSETKTPFFLSHVQRRSAFAERSLERASKTPLL